MNKILMAIGGLILILGILTSGFTPFQITDADLVDDSYVSEIEPDTNFNEEDLLTVDTGTILNDKVIFVKFNVGLPVNITLNNADLTLTKTTASQLPVVNTLCAQQVLDDWDESTITWNNQPNYVSPSGDIGTCTNVGPSVATFNVTSIVQNWITGNASLGLHRNFGFAIVHFGSGIQETFHSKDSIVITAVSPTLTIDYTIPDDGVPPIDDRDLIPPIEGNETVIITDDDIIDTGGVISQPEIPLISWFLIIVGAILLLAGWFSKGR